MSTRRIYWDMKDGSESWSFTKILQEIIQYPHTSDITFAPKLIDSYQISNVDI